MPSVAKALEVGYRHIDTAAMYGNERGVGHAIQDSGLGDNVWVTTKLNNDAHGFDAAMKAFDASMDKLQRETLDLYLIHWPLPRKDRYAEAWKAMQALRDDGRITTIGVCNFQVPHLQSCTRRPASTPRSTRSSCTRTSSSRSCATSTRRTASSRRPGARWRPAASAC